MKTTYTPTEQHIKTAREFYQRAVNDNGGIEGMDDWHAFSITRTGQPDLIIDMNAYQYGEWTGVTAYVVNDIGEIDTSSGVEMFKEPYAPTEIDDDDDSVDFSSVDTTDPAKVLFFAKTLDLQSLIENEHSIENIVWLIGLLEKALEDSINKQTEGK